MRSTRKGKIVHFLFLKSLNRFLLVSSIVAILLAGIVVLILNAQNKLSVVAIINVLLVALPLVMFLLCIVASALFSIDLSKKNIAVNKLSRFESLLKIKTLCVGKDNVITDGVLTIKKVIPLKTVATEQYIDQWMSNVLRATNDKGAIFDALSKQFDLELSAGVVNVSHYNDGIKYSGATFKGGKTIVLGNPEFVPVKNKIGILKRCEEDINKGCHILVLAEGKEQIDNNGYPGEVEAIALIVLKDHVREGSFETFKWFKDNGIDIKVISSDNALVTSVTAAEAGIEGADKYVSLKDLEIETMDGLVSQYTVFGDASPEQKEMIITSLKKDQKVMMIGGNENDVLPMKASDFAAATIDGDINAQDNADIVLDGSSFEPLPLVVDESKVFMNNMQKVLSLALAKTALAFIAVLLFTIFNDNLKQCLFVFNNLLLWDLITNGVVALLFIFDKKNKKTSDSFFKNVLRNAIPMTVLQIIGVSTVFVLYAMQNNQLLSTGLYSMDNVAVMSVLLFAVLGIVSLYNICVPLNKRRRLIVILGAGLNVLVIAVFMLIAYLTGNKEMFYLSMNAPAYFITAIIAVIYSAIYLFINRIIGIVKGDNLENEN